MTSVELRISAGRPDVDLPEQAERIIPCEQLVADAGQIDLNLEYGVYGVALWLRGTLPDVVVPSPQPYCISALPERRLIVSDHCAEIVIPIPTRATLAAASLPSCPGARSTVTGPDTAPPDAGAPDAGPFDAGSFDAGLLDASFPDADTGP